VTNTFSSASRILIITAALVIVVGGMKLAAPILVPFLLAIFIAVICFPLMSKLQDTGLPKGLSLLLVNSGSFWFDVIDEQFISKF